jgi:energy-converting hydrogenase Eha subunit E
MYLLLSTNWNCSIGIIAIVYMAVAVISVAGLLMLVCAAVNDRVYAEIEVPINVVGVGLSHSEQFLLKLLTFVALSSHLVCLYAFRLSTCL